MNFIKSSEQLFVWKDENIVTMLCNYNVDLYDDTLFSQGKIMNVLQSIFVQEISQE